MPAVSVVIPTYNRATLLEAAVRSVFAQTFADWELIVVDDDSSDGTREYLESFSDPRLHVILSGHTGNPAPLQNLAIQQARGEWIAFLDSDDAWLPEKLAQQLDALRQCPECGWSCTGFEFMDASGVPVAQQSGVPYDAQGGWILERLLTFDATTPLPTIMVRRALLLDVGGMDECFSIRADYDLELRLAARSAICAIPDILTRIRIHSGRTTSGASLESLLDDNARVFAKASAAATSGHLRSLCDRQRAVQLAYKVGVASRAGEHSAALRYAFEAAAAFPFSRRVWRSTIGAVLRAGIRAREGP